MLHLSTLLKHYKRRDIQEAMVLAAEHREVAVKFGESGFGKRPEILNYPSDVLEFAKQGATSFHMSEERWSNVLHVSTGMTKKELDGLRKGWDLVLDIDCKLWDYSKLIAHLMVQELRVHGITSITAKFSGNKGFHIAVPFEAFPKEVHGEPIHLLFPEGVRRIAGYLVEKIKPKLLEHITLHDTFANIARHLEMSEQDLYKLVCSSCKKARKNEVEKVEFHCLSCGNKEDGTPSDKFRVCGKCFKIMEKLDVSSIARCPYCKNMKFVEELDLGPLLQVDTVLISSRHLYRMPYSLHEKSGLCSIPVDPEKILSFEKEMARPELVLVKIPFLQTGSVIFGEASRLILEAFDALPDAKQEKETFAKKIGIAADGTDEETLQRAIPAEFFPPCMKLGLHGLKDGKKRFMFMLVNFLLSTGYDYAAIDAILDEWNKKNPEPLREVLLKGQVRYAQQTRKKVLPPNCDNQGYYVDMQICQPDGLCGRIKNPVQYAKRRAFLANLRQEAEQNGAKGMRVHLTDEQKEMRRRFREGKKEKVEEFYS
jgi:DNA-directed RNA polymerase subunit RPC12/RpoP